jgi:hypothetical protein
MVILLRVDVGSLVDVSEIHVPSIFWVEVIRVGEPPTTLCLLSTRRVTVWWLFNSRRRNWPGVDTRPPTFLLLNSTLKAERACTFETSAMPSRAESTSTMQHHDTLKSVTEALCVCFN